ncbi:MAG: asparaginase, partial [Calditrichales bacterium]
MKKILVIHTGGTFGMTPAEPDQTLKPGNIEKDLNENLPFVRDFADISIRIPFNLDSSDIGPDEWVILYRLIKEEIDQYDGIVMIHGTDTLVYTAAALSFLLNDLNKPVILTGSQRPLSALRSDARGNLINSVELATFNVPEVLVCFGNRLFRGNRTKKISIESFQSFDSPNYPPLATIGLNVSLNKPYILANRTGLKLEAKFDPHVLPVQIFPGLTPEPFQNVLNGTTRAIILEGFGAGNFPAVTSAWIEFIQHAKSAG